MSTAHVTPRRRYATAALVAAAVVGCAGCGAGTAEVPQKTAQVTVNGQSRTSHAVICTQVGWMLSIDITDGSAQTRAMLRLEPDKPKLESVNINDFNGFTGLVDGGAGGAGKAEATFAAGTYHIVGTAERTNLDNPDEPSNGAFTIDVTC